MMLCLEIKNKNWQVIQLPGKTLGSILVQKKERKGREGKGGEERGEEEKRKGKSVINNHRELKQIGRVSTGTAELGDSGRCYWAHGFFLE